MGARLDNALDRTERFFSVLASPLASRKRRSSEADPATGALSRLSIHQHSSEEQDSSSPSSPSPSPALEQHQCTSAECAVTTLFETTELLEIVLGFLDTDSVLNLRRTSRQWNNTIRGSPSLRLHHFVRPNWTRAAADFELLDLKLPGLSIVPGDDIEMGKWIHVSMTLAAARRICVVDTCGRRVRSRSIFEGMRGGLGRRTRPPGTDSWPALPPTTEDDGSIIKHELLKVMQPPIVGMQAYTIEPASVAGPCQLPDQDQNEDQDWGPSPRAKLHCDAGISLGFLAETTQSLLAGPRARGSEATAVVFKAIVSFTTPVVPPRTRSAARSVVHLD